jgi:purine-binding chemotaxis protein CheW
MSTSVVEPRETTKPPFTRSTDALAGKYLTFQIADEEYGLPVLKVREIIKIMDITAVPQVPAHVRGVVNLRGKVIPVVDLRMKFGFPQRDYDDRTCIIVVEISTLTSRMMMGVIIDAVSEVLNISAEEIEETPDFGARVNADYIKAMAKVKGRVKMLVDLDRVLSGDHAGV